MTAWDWTSELIRDARTEFSVISIDGDIYRPYTKKGLCSGDWFPDWFPRYRAPSVYCRYPRPGPSVRPCHAKKDQYTSQSQVFKYGVRLD
jgi:hypothetical protein